MTSEIFKPSENLSSLENEIVFRLVGHQCVSLCTTIAQIYATHAPFYKKWNKFYTGVLCVVKDDGKQSYFLRLFCLMNHELVWEQEVYRKIKIDQARRYLITFEGQNGMVGLNFAFQQEADNFMTCVKAIVNNLNRKPKERLQPNRLLIISNDSKTKADIKKPAKHEGLNDIPPNPENWQTIAKKSFFKISKSGEIQLEDRPTQNLVSPKASNGSVRSENGFLPQNLQRKQEKLPKTTRENQNLLQSPPTPEIYQVPSIPARALSRRNSSIGNPPIFPKKQIEAKNFTIGVFETKQTHKIQAPTESPQWPPPPPNNLSRSESLVEIPPIPPKKNSGGESIKSKPKIDTPLTLKAQRSMIAEKECKICFMNEKHYALLPCGHVFCAECSLMALKMRVCHVCRSDVSDFNRIYL